MNRRSFVAASASAFSLTAAAPVGSLLKQSKWGKGERVRLAGVLERAPNGAGHFFVFRSETAFGRDALTGAGRTRAVVFPTDAKSMRPGRAVLQGRLFQGKFADEPTGHTASTVLTEARLV
jgi:hypothetical protein